MWASPVTSNLNFASKELTQKTDDGITQDDDDDDDDN